MFMSKKTTPISNQNLTKEELDLWQMRLFRKMRSPRSGISQKLRK
jgi:hypothetical protein